MRSPTATERGASITAVGAMSSRTTTLALVGALTFPASSTTTSSAVIRPGGRPGGDLNVASDVATSGRLPTVQRYSMTRPPMSLEREPDRDSSAVFDTDVGASSTAVGALSSTTTKVALVDALWLAESSTTTSEAV